MMENLNISEAIDIIRDISISDIINSNNADINYCNGILRIKTNIKCIPITLTLTDSTMITNHKPLRKRKNCKKINHLEAVKKLLEEGKKQKDIALILGISDSYVCVLKKQLTLADQAITSNNNQINKIEIKENDETINLSNTI